MSRLVITTEAAHVGHPFKVNLKKDKDSASNTGNRRKSTRFKYHAIATMSYKKKLYSAQIEDISPKGIRIKSYNRFMGLELQKNEIVWLEYNLNDTQSTLIRDKCLVVYVNSGVAGLQILTDDYDKAQLAKVSWLNSKEIQLPLFF